MDSFEWNKIAGAVLFALLVAFGLGIFSEILFETEAPESPGYLIAVAEPGEGAGGEAAPASQPIGVLLAAADVAAGESSAKKCSACHTFGSGEANKVGPNLWDIVDRPIASHEGYAYSDPMHAFGEQEQSWTYDHLNTYLADPKGVVPGTKMAFAGLKNDSERANVIAYLRTLSDSPKPLPPPEAAQTASADPNAPVPAEPAEASAEDAAAAPAEGAGQPDPQASGEGEAPQSPTPTGEEEAADAGSDSDAAAPAAPAQETAEAEAPAAEQQAATPAAEAPAAAEPAPPESVAPAPAQQPAQTEAPAEQQTAQAEAPAAAEAPAEPAPAEGAAPAAAGGAASGFAAAVAAADVAKGETFAKRCIACHSFDEGGPNKVGPHLYGVVNRPIASVADYSYSEAMKAFAEGGKVWDYDTLHTYLENPRGVVPGTKMIFPGIKSEADRANVVAYLRSLAAEPAPLPAQ